jgi:hypothetical protein
VLAQGSGGLLLLGCGDGSVDVFDLATLQRLFALTASQHTMRMMYASRDNIVCYDDDCKAMGSCDR